MPKSFAIQVAVLLIIAGIPLLVISPNPDNAVDPFTLGVAFIMLGTVVLIGRVLVSQFNSSRHPWN